ncbi:hypothetical protein BSY17_3986 (plasmid) [Sphingobium sp. RAC03]|nr:hypothetical protein BSY17_3986 [Sphingobium sp. RAC03]
MLYTTIRISAPARPTIPGVLATVGHLHEPIPVDLYRVA